VWVEWVGLEAWAALAGRVELVMGIVHQHCRRVVAAIGNITHNIAAERLTAIALPQTDLAEQRAVIHWRTGKRAHASKWAGRVGI
jgi:hypothetical protein